MSQIGVSFLVGLIAGIAGGLAAHVVGGGDDSSAGGSSLGGTDLSSIEARLDRIEGAVAGRKLISSSPALRGTRSAEGPAAADPDLDILAAKLEERLRPLVEETVKTSMRDALEERGGELKVGMVEKVPKRKRVTLAEAAAELELTRDQEDAVRRIARESTDALFKLMAGKDQTVDDIRREFEDAKDDPEKRRALSTKYLGKVIGNIGGVITLGLTHDRKMKEAVGAEKARKIEKDYHLTDLDPFDLENMFKID